MLKRAKEKEISEALYKQRGATVLLDWLRGAQMLRLNGKPTATVTDKIHGG
jgi:hypothetical protein